MTNSMVKNRGKKASAIVLASVLVVIILIATFSIVSYMKQRHPAETPAGEENKTIPITKNETAEKSLSVAISIAPKFPEYSYQQKTYSNPEYSLPLTELPENYQRDFVERFGNSLSEEQQRILLKNGVLILPGDEYERFENVYEILKQEDIPTFVTADSTLHLFHIEFNEILKNLEIKKLSPMLKQFLSATIKETERQYQTSAETKEHAKRNLAYLSVAMKLLDPDYNVPSSVKSEVEKEISKIEKHEGFFRSNSFSLDCPEQCLPLAFKPDDSCNQAVKGLVIEYQGKSWDSLEFYREVCTRKCYCEDYSQYVPRGHYTQTEELKRYFKSMMWLGRMSFKARSEDWTKQALLLTIATENAKVNFEGKEINATELWNKIYSVTGFFAGVSDDLTFYDYSRALNEIIGRPANLDDVSNLNITKFQEKISELRGPSILGGFEIDLAGNLKDLTQGMRLIGQRYAVDSQILGDLVYKNVGPNPDSPYYDELSNLTCNDMENDKLSKGWNKEQYWNKVCEDAILSYSEQPEKLYSVCRFMPSGLDVLSVLGSKKAEEILREDYSNGYCDYSKKQKELKELVASYDKTKWTQNLYNTWLWMLQPILEEKGKGYPEWMRSDVWKLKEVITALSSWAELRHDTILYVKQSYTWAVGLTGAMPPPMEAMYYGYVEPNPELFARAKYAVNYLNEGLGEQGVMTEEVSNVLLQSSDMMERLRGISEKELNNEALTEEDYIYIKRIDAVFNDLIEQLASAIVVEEAPPTGGEGHMIAETSLEGFDEASRTDMIADVHTETNTKKVLEVGTGKVDWLIVAHKSKDGRIGIAIGPMFSYYEFAWPMSDRLTDEKWRSEVLKDMERHVIYSETGIKASSSPYIIKNE